MVRGRKRNLSSGTDEVRTKRRHVASVTPSSSRLSSSTKPFDPYKHGQLRRKRRCLQLYRKVQCYCFNQRHRKRLEYLQQYRDYGRCKGRRRYNQRWSVFHKNGKQNIHLLRAPPAADRHSGVVLDNRYQIVCVIGEGTFGKVFRANDLREGKSKAIKVISSEMSDREDALMEVHILKKLREFDPSGSHLCATMLDWFECRGDICIVFDVLGLNVYDFLKENNFQPYVLPDVRHIIYQLCYSVKFLHDNKITHTDLKPENVVFVNSDYDIVFNNVTNKYFKKIKRTDIRLIDFGSAVFDYEPHDKVITTRNYRAPEVILKLGWSQSCDVWSIGCILFELYVGSTLFPVNNNKQHLAMMERILGPLPYSIIRKSGYSYQAYGRLKWNKASKHGRWIMRNRQQPVRGLHEHELLFDLVRHMLKYVPASRITLTQSLRHPFFRRLEPHKKRGLRCAGGDE